MANMNLEKAGEGMERERCLWWAAIRGARRVSIS
jgi:hypothetical protein